MLKPCWARLAIAGFVLFGICPAGLADEVFLNDGTVLYGQVITARKKTAEGFEMPAGDGVYAVFDGCRIVVFSRLQLDPARQPVIGETRANLLKLDRERVITPVR